jgi:succinate dehydrogenase / fumarate reductase cytochrome b subunit
MPSLMKAARSQVGRKILTGITGVALILFIIIHLSGNLSLFGAEHAFNKYTHALESLGWLLYIAEAGLAFVFLLHAYIGVSIYLRKRKARPVGYDTYKSKGEPSKQSVSSRSMAITGIVLLIFLVFHIAHFKFGDTGTVMVDGQQIRDLKSLVVDSFVNPAYAFGYTFVMILLGLHLRHGVWSALTSLTMKHKKYSVAIYSAAAVVAFLLAAGFLTIPLYIFFNGGL